MFLFIVLTVWTGLHAYVFWRAWSVPLIAGHVSPALFIAAAVLLWLSFPAAQIREHSGTSTAFKPLMTLGANWLGILFLMFACMLFADIATGFGFLSPRLAPTLRGAALVAAALLSAIALVQGHRPPVVQDYEVRPCGLPPDLDGLRLVAVADTHLGTLLGAHWLADRVAQFNEQAKVRPGLVFAGVNDIDERQRSADDDQRLARAFADAPAHAATVFLSHRPEGAAQAATAGADLMLAGHTHDGQIQPFRYRIGLANSYVGGRYDANGMPVIVGRGTGTWGPRIRLWGRNEIVRVVLRTL